MLNREAIIRDIEKNKIRGDLGITYDLDVLRLIDAFRGIGLLCKGRSLCGCGYGRRGSEVL